MAVTLRHCLPSPKIHPAQTVLTRGSNWSWARKTGAVYSSRFTSVTGVLLKSGSSARERRVQSGPANPNLHLRTLSLSCFELNIKQLAGADSGVDTLGAHAP